MDAGEPAGAEAAEFEERGREEDEASPSQAEPTLRPSPGSNGKIKAIPT